MLGNILLPIVFLLISGGIYFGLTDPLITGGELVALGEVQGITQLTKEKEALNQALRDAKNLEDRIGELQGRVDSISQEDIDRLDIFLPDSIDNMQLVVDLNDIANRSNMRLGSVSLEESEAEDVASSEELDADPVVENTSISFEITGTYADLKSFLNDVASSLRVMDVTALEFSSANEGSGEYTYNITILTYWLR